MLVRGMLISEFIGKILQGAAWVSSSSSKREVGGVERGRDRVCLRQKHLIVLGVEPMQN